MRRRLARPVMLGGGASFAAGLLLFLLGQRWAIGVVFGGFFLAMVGTVLGDPGSQDTASGDGGGDSSGGDGE